MRASTGDEQEDHLSTPLFLKNLALIAAGVMELHWQPDALYSAPNAAVYPWMWLWDSCFHSIVWAWLGDCRCQLELASVFAVQAPNGFVPHMGYQRDPGAAMDFWGVNSHSTITQPPMYGHAVRVLMRLGYQVDDLHTKVRAGLLHLLDTRTTEVGLLAIYHPWESGADDSPRWERWQPRPFVRERWAETKRQLVTALHVQDTEAIGSSSFAVCSASFNALVAWNAIEAGKALQDYDLMTRGKELARRIDAYLWDDALGTWVDVGCNGVVTSRVRTLESLLPVLVTRDATKQVCVFEALLSESEFAAPYGPSGVHPNEPTYDPLGYWRGSTWPQLIYLLWQGALQAGPRFTEHARALGVQLARGAEASGFAEYWNPETGEGLGARPQSWTSLAAIPQIATLGKPTR